jgi:hypothetical protein
VGLQPLAERGAWVVRQAGQAQRGEATPAPRPARHDGRAARAAGRRRQVSGRPPCPLRRPGPGWRHGAAGRRAEDIAFRLLRGVLAPLLALAPGDHLLFALDDTPTARYGPHVQGAGVHHNPSPGPAGEKFVYGHF